MIAHAKTLTIGVDRTFRAMIEETVAALSKLDANLAGEAGEFALDLGKLLEEFRLVQANRSAAAGAGELIVGLEPSDRLRRFLAAARARDFKAMRVEIEAWHG
jgi:hypothetical protein